MQKLTVIEEPLRVLLSREGFSEQATAYSQLSKFGVGFSRQSFSLDQIIKMEELGLYRAFSLLDGGKIVGFMGYIKSYLTHVQGEIAMVESLWVDPQYRGMGGAKLIRAAINKAKGEGCKGVVLSLPYGERAELKMFKPTDTVYTYIFKERE